MLECNSCRKTFLHAAKQTITQIQGSPFVSIGTDATEKPLSNKTVERSVCPYCESFDMQEAAEQIASVKDVAHSEVDTYLKDGYIVHAIYAKNTVMKKLAETKKP